jgi:hypothetical protein
VFAGALLCAALSGCGSAPGDGPQLPPAIYAGPITSPVRYDNAGIVLEVPATTTVGVTWSQAYENCRTGEAVCDTSHSPTISLARATTLASGEAGADGSITPAVNDQLVYVIAWNDAICPAPAGPAHNTENAGPCQIVDLIDAASGRVLFSVHGADL